MTAEEKLKERYKAQGGEWDYETNEVSGRVRIDFGRYVLLSPPDIDLIANLVVGRLNNDGR